MTKVMLDQAHGKTIKSIVTEDDDTVIICFTDGTQSTIKAELAPTSPPKLIKLAVHLTYA